MANQSDRTPEPELQLMIAASVKDNDNTDIIPVDLILQYRILDKKCDAILKKISDRRSKKN